MPQLLCEKRAGIVFRDLSLPSYPGRLYDLYFPFETEISGILICLHGGGGDKNSFAGQIGLAKTANAQLTGAVRWQLLKAYRTIVIIPNGSFCNGTVSQFNPNGIDTRSPANPNGVKTWASYDFFAQDDDLLFLQLLAITHCVEYDVVGVNIAGHSLGGICTQMLYQRQMPDSPFFPNVPLWRRFISLAGPRAEASLLSSQLRVNPFEQFAKVPYLQQYGSFDENLCTFNGPAGPGDHFYDTFWEATLANFSPVTYSFPNPARRFGAFSDLQNIVDLYNEFSGNPPETVSPSDGVTTAIASGTRETWLYGGGKIQFERLSTAGHKPSTFARAQGKYPIRYWLEWIAATAV